MASYLTEDLKWVSFYPKFSSSFYVNKAGYFDERPEIVTSITQVIVLFALPFLVFQSLWFVFIIPFILFGWGKLYIHLPIRTGIQDCASAAWGLYYYSNALWFCIGGGGNFEGGRRTKSYSMPWQLDWVRTSTLLNNSNWFNETKHSKLNWTSDNVNIIGSYGWLKENKWKEIHPFTDSFDGTIVNATISVEEMEWRPKWFKWTSLFRKVRKSIDIEFDKEVGKRKGSWKGGTIGCGYELRKNETPLECLRRMEKERKF